MAVEAVSSEPVSHRFPCYAGKIQGIFAIQADFDSFRAAIVLKNGRFFIKFPTRRNREFNRCIRELAGNSST